MCEITGKPQSQENIRPPPGRSETAERGDTAAGGSRLPVKAGIPIGVVHGERNGRGDLLPQRSRRSIGTRLIRRERTGRGDLLPRSAVVLPEPRPSVDEGLGSSRAPLGEGLKSPRTSLDTGLSSPRLDR